MAGALGLLTGVGLGAAAGFAKQQRQKKEQHDSAVFDFYSKNPQLVADSPEAQSFIKGYAGKDASTAFITMANHVKQASQMFGQQLAGGGGGASGTAGAPPVAGQAAPSSPTDPTTQLRDNISKLESYLASPDSQYLNKEQLEAGKNQLEAWRQEYGRLQGASLKTADELAREKRAPGVEAEKTKARIGVETSPETVRAKSGAEATIGAARSGAETRAKLAPDIVAGEVSETGRKAEATAKAREGKAADPEVEANRRATRFNAMVTSYSKLYPPPTGWTGSRKDAATPEGKKWLQGLSQYLADHGMGPNGELLASEPTATGPNGAKMVFRGGKWVPM